MYDKNRDINDCHLEKELGGAKNYLLEEAYQVS